MTENANESAPDVVEDTPLPSEPVEVATDAEQQAEPVDAGVDEVEPAASNDEDDVPFALSRETADGSGFASEAEADELESDFESFAEDDVEGDDDEDNA